MAEDIAFDAARGRVTYRIMAESQVHAQGELVSTAHVPCARCLTKVPQAIRAEIHMFYWPASQQSDPDSKIEYQSFDVKIDLAFLNDF